mgnify:CR=1 FL=1
MHSPLEIARNYIEVGIHKVNLSIFKTILLGFFAGMFIGFAGIASTTASSTIGIASVAKLVGATVFPAGMAMVLVAGSELFTGNNLIILAVLEKKVTVWKMLKNWLFRNRLVNVRSAFHNFCIFRNSYILPYFNYTCKQI